MAATVRGKDDERRLCSRCSHHYLPRWGDCLEENPDALDRGLLYRVFPLLSVSRILPSFSLRYEVVVWYEVVVCHQL